MSTKRLAIRNALLDAVRAAVPGAKVHVNLDHALDDKTLPAVVVSSLADEVGETTGSRFASGAETVTAHFSVAILVSRSGDPEASADAIEGPIRDALRSDPSLAGTVNVFRYAGGEWAFDLGDCAVRRLNFKSIYIA